MLVNFSVAQTINPENIDIVRDKFGVPHIFGKTDAEVAYGLAWAHAEDDFNTIQQGAMVGKSMLGLHKGKEGATIDFIVKFLHCRELVESRYEQDISSEYKKLLQGYCDGINAFANAHQDKVLLKKLFPLAPKDMLTYSVLQLCISSGVDGALKRIFDGTIPLAQFAPTGSNGFAFNSKKTADGQTYLAINSHQPLEGPVSWYEAHLCSEEGWNILGALFPGSPTILHGCNEYLGWAHTVNNPDKLDVYQLEINPANKLQYKFDGKWESLTEETVRLHLKVMGITVSAKRKVYTSKYGPTLITDRGTFSIRTGALDEIRALEQWYKMNKAKNFTEFRNVMKMIAIPGYNVVYADRYDTIYYLSNGKIPVRNSAYNWKSTLPGNTSQTLWTEMYPLERLPQLINPSSGYLFNSNHTPFNASSTTDNLKTADYPAAMGFETHNNNRSLRFMELISQKDKVSYEDFKRIKYDIQLPSTFGYRMNIDTLFRLKPNDYPAISELITSLNSWDHKANVESTAATVFAVIYYYVTDQSRSGRAWGLTKAQCVDALTFTKEYLLKNFKKLDAPLGEYQKLVRGEKEVPLPGVPDVISSMLSVQHKDGKIRGQQGESYIELVRFTEQGPEIESVNCYGASNEPSSPHYADQMELFTQQKTKRMTLNKAEVYKTAERVYHPK